MHGCNGCDPYGAVNEDCPIHGNPAHEETRSRLAEVTAERDAALAERDRLAYDLLDARSAAQAHRRVAREALTERDQLREGVERVAAAMAHNGDLMSDDRWYRGHACASREAATALAALLAPTPEQEPAASRTPEEEAADG